MFDLVFFCHFFTKNGCFCDIPVYSILTLLGEFGRWAQIGIFLGCKKVRFFFVKSFLLDPTKPLLPSTKCTQKCQKKTSLLRGRQSKRSFPFYIPLTRAHKSAKKPPLLRGTRKMKVSTATCLCHILASTHCRIVQVVETAKVVRTHAQL